MNHSINKGHNGLVVKCLDPKHNSHCSF